MNWDEEWTYAQELLRIASQNDRWWRELLDEQRNLLGRIEYKRECQKARLQVKIADARCRALVKMRKRHGGSISRKLEQVD